jgi:hypothetical protein
MQQSPEYFRVSRETRLLRLLTIKAPSEIIKHECRLLLASYCGSHIRAILWLLKIPIKSKLSRLLDDLQVATHSALRLCGLHIVFRDALSSESSIECWICDREQNSLADIETIC